MLITHTNRKSGIPGDLNSRTSEISEIWNTGFAEFRTFDLPELRKIRVSGNPEFRKLGNPEFRTSGNWISGNAGSRSLDFAKFRPPEAWFFENPSFRKLGFSKLLDSHSTTAPSLNHEVLNGLLGFRSTTRPSASYHRRFYTTDRKTIQHLCLGFQRYALCSLHIQIENPEFRET